MAVSYAPTYVFCSVFCASYFALHFAGRAKLSPRTSPASHIVHGARTVAARIPYRCFLLLPMYMCRYNRLYLSDPTRSNFVINPFALTGRIFACVSIYSSLSLSLSLCVCVGVRARCGCLSVAVYPCISNSRRSVLSCLCISDSVYIFVYGILVSLSRCT